MIWPSKGAGNKNAQSVMMQSMMLPHPRQMQHRPGNIMMTWAIGGWHPGRTIALLTAPQAMPSPLHCQHNNYVQEAPVEMVARTIKNYELDVWRKAYWKNSLPANRCTSNAFLPLAVNITIYCTYNRDLVL